MNRQRATLLLLVLIFAATRAFALDPSRALTQSRLSVWTSDSGLPQNTIEAMVQTSDGYLWLGTEEGLVRSDGVRFVISDRQSAPALRSAFVSSVFESRDGTLWIGTYGGGLARLRNGKIEAFHPEVLGSDRIRAFASATDNVAYFFGEDIFIAIGSILLIKGFLEQNGIRVEPAQLAFWAIPTAIAVATHGGGVVRWRDSRVQQTITTREGLPNDLARALLRDPDGTLWIGTDGGGLVAWRNGAIVRTITTRDGLPSNLIRSLLRDRDGSLWIGTDGGLARWRGTRAEILGVAEGLPSPIVRSLIEDREGSLWVGTSGGLVRLSDTRFRHFRKGAIRRLSSDGRTVQFAFGLGLVERRRPVQRAAVVPHYRVPVTPLMAVHELWLGAERGQLVQERMAFLR